MNRQALTTLALVALAGVAVPASAQEATRRVSYVDLDLSRPEGVATLRHRVAVAIREVCGEYDARDLFMNGLVRRCRRETELRTQPQLALAVYRARDFALAANVDTEIAVR
jgi:UrcA family protein